MAAAGEKQKAVVELYENSTGAFEEIFGEHLHDGYYEPGTTATVANHQAAVVRIIDEALRFADVSADDPAKKPRNVLDVGCGIGSTCLYIARKFDVPCKGINISPGQVKRAQASAAARGLESKVSFDVGDALDMPYPDGTFDLVFSIQCIEHLQDKEKFIREMVRVAAPGAAVIILSYAHRILSPDESLNPQENKVLQKICESYVMPSLCSSDDFIRWLTLLPVEDIKRVDWTQNTAPFYELFFKEVYSWRGFTSFLMKGGWSAIKFVLGVKRMAKAVDDGLIKYVTVSCRKQK
uniref:Tocopherol-like methyltransferase n=1 Tax=Rauvolfia serpentina TaxID=4060 RepID=A0A075D800_RAUSE|nr:tocopherol-like methyltransferase [Rauvolfia serpentina]